MPRLLPRMGSYLMDMNRRCGANTPWRAVFEVLEKLVPLSRGADRARGQGS